MALGISLQDWKDLGSGKDENVAASSDLEVTVERVTALLMIRIVAWIQPRGKYTDLSTTCICRETLIPDIDSDDEDSVTDCWPQSMTPKVVAQLRQYVKFILNGYETVPYHSMEHCYHVVISVNKLMDLLLNGQDMNIPKNERPSTFGFKDDPLMQLALLFAALIHDVGHQGIPNRQLSMENDVLAIQYNDQSIAEHRSLYIGFFELLKPEYKDLRDAVFPEIDDYRRFRKAVVNLVLTTDIASPERTQLVKSKWKEAFGDPYETVERKVRKQMERRNSQKSQAHSAGRAAGMTLSLHSKANRRMSAQSIMSELSLDHNSYDLDMEEDESVSATPDTSEDEGPGPTPKYCPPLVESPGRGGGGPVFRPPVTQNVSPAKMRRVKDPSQTRHQSMEMNRSLSNMNNTGSLSGMTMKFHRRLSNIGGGPAVKQRQQRLGLLRTLDLSGEEIETYSHASHVRSSATGAFTTSDRAHSVQPPEEVDELCESVVMEAILRAADVAHNLQSWDNMAKWSNRLFLELRRAYVQGRGEDPQNGWFSNQIGFLEGYLLPVARRLDDTGVFGDTIGAMFAEGVEDNRERWMREGMSLTASIIREGDEIYPEEDSEAEDDE